MNFAKIEEVNNGQMGMKLWWTKLITMSVGLQFISCRGCPIPASFNWTDRLWKILGIYFGPNFQMEKNWPELICSLERIFP